MNKKFLLLSFVFGGVLVAGQATNSASAPVQQVASALGANPAGGTTASAPPFPGTAAIPGVLQAPVSSVPLAGSIVAAPQGLPPVPGANAIPSVVGAPGVAPVATSPSASGSEAPSVDKKFLVSIDITQRALDDATAFVPVVAIDGKDRAVCFAGQKGAELPGYVIPGEQLADPASTCVVLDPVTKAVQKITDATQISGQVSTVPLQWSALKDATPQQLWFVRQQVGVCSSRDKAGKISGVGAFDLNDQNKACYLNDRVATLNDSDIVVLLK